jgi:hypothetical protein
MLKGVILYGFLIFSLMSSFLTKVRQKGYINQTRNDNQDLSKIILYLRGFGLDEDGDDIDNFSIFRLSNTETALTAKLVKLGRLITVGKNGEYIPEAGFERKYFSDDEWQVEVAKLIERSHIIILRASTSRWLLWELGEILKTDARKKMILWTKMGYESLGVSGKVRYNVFKKVVKEKFDEELPDYGFYIAATSASKNNWETAPMIENTPLYQRVEMGY